MQQLSVKINDCHERRSKDAVTCIFTGEWHSSGSSPLDTQTKYKEGCQTCTNVEEHQKRIQFSSAGLSSVDINGQKTLPENSTKDCKPMKLKSNLICIIWKTWEIRKVLRLVRAAIDVTPAESFLPININKTVSHK